LRDAPGDELGRIERRAHKTHFGLECALPIGQLRLIGRDGQPHAAFGRARLGRAFERMQTQGNVQAKRPPDHLGEGARRHGFADHALQ